MVSVSITTRTAVPGLAVLVPEILKVVSLVMKSLALKPVSSVMPVMLMPKEALKRVDRSLRLAVWLPLSFLAAMAAKKAARLLLVTSVKPIRLKSAAVNAGDGVWPAAVVWMALAMRASSLRSAMRSTPAALCLSRMLLSRARLSASVAAAPMLAPSKANSAAVTAAPALAVPSARAKTLL